jgi:hypothetical protein
VSYAKARQQRRYPTQSLRGYPTQPLRGLFSDDPEDRAERMFGDGVIGRPFSHKAMNVLFRSWGAAEFPPTPFAVRISADRGLPFSFASTGGLAWDGATKLAVPKQVITLDGNTFFRVDSVEGQRLELWVDDTWPLVDAVLLPLQKAAEEQKKQIEEKREDDPVKTVTTAVAVALVGYALISALRR